MMGMTDEQKRAVIQQVVVDCEKASKMTTDALLDLLPVPGDIEQQSVLVELFQRGVLYQINERYPESKDETIDMYNQYCRMLAIIAPRK